MTNSSFITDKNSIGVIPVPFGHNGTLSTIGTTSNNETINYPQGFPDKYATAVASGGKYLIRGDFNAIGHVGTANNFFMQCGGYHTFTSSVSGIISGYSYGILLDWYDTTNNVLRKVRCVKTDGNCTTPIDDAVNGVNGTGTHYWKIVDYNDKCWDGTITYGDTVNGTIANFTTLQSTYSSSSFTSPYNMKVVFSFTCTGGYAKTSAVDTWYSFLSVYNPTSISWVPIRLCILNSGSLSETDAGSITMYIKKGTILKGQLNKVVEAGGYAGCSLSITYSGKIIA